MTGDGPSADRCDVVVIGGGPAGSSAAVFAARYGLDTVVFDRGPAALPRCAFLANYPGFPAGIDVETFRALLHDHVERAGARLVAESVESVRRSEADDEDRRFAIETAEARRVDARFVLAASWYDGSYLRPLGDESMFEPHEHHGEERERFDPTYPDDDGRTPVDGLYVASPAGDRSAQAVVAAGNGAHVVRCLLEDHRTARGYPGGVAAHYDWRRPESEFTGEWADRDRWRTWFEREAGDDHGLDDESFEELREAYIDRAFETELSDGGVERRTEAAQHRLLDHLDDEHIRSYLEGESDDGERATEVTD